MTVIPGVREISCGPPEVILSCEPPEVTVTPSTPAHVTSDRYPIHTETPVHGLVELSAVCLEPSNKWTPQIVNVVCPSDLPNETTPDSRRVWDPPKQMPDFFLPNSTFYVLTSCFELWLRVMV